jgi:hypothetical protein
MTEWAKAEIIQVLANEYQQNEESDGSYYAQILDLQIGEDTGENQPSSRVIKAIPEADDGPQQTASKRSRMIERMMSEETALIPPIFSQKDLLGRGWSKRLIAQLLGEPDSTSPNPHGSGLAPMKCWNQGRVVAAEATAAFRERS